MPLLNKKQSTICGEKKRAGEKDGTGATLHYQRKEKLKTKGAKQFGYRTV